MSALFNRITQMMNDRIDRSFLSSKLHFYDAIENIKIRTIPLVFNWIEFRRIKFANRVRLKAFLLFVIRLFAGNLVGIDSTVSLAWSSDGAAFGCLSATCRASRHHHVIIFSGLRFL